MEQFVEWYFDLIPVFEPKWLYFLILFFQIGITAYLVFFGFGLFISLFSKFFNSLADGYMSEKYPKSSGIILSIILISIIVIWIWLGSQGKSYRPLPEHPFDF